MQSIEELMSKKKENLSTEEDIEKYELLEEMMEDKEIFFQMDIDTVMGILEFLDVPEEEWMNYYRNIVSMENSVKDSRGQPKTGALKQAIQK